MEFGSPQFWLAGLEIIVVNILLSGDNAVVIALACRNLPARQRRWGVFWGALGAIVLRIVLTAFAAQMLEFPWLKIIGGVLLVWIGIKLIIEEEGEGSDIKASDRLFAAVRTVIVADLVMSIDNVVAVAAAAHGSNVLLIFGLALSIPLVIVGAQLILRLIERFPILIVGGGGLLGFIAGELFATDTAIKPWVGTMPAWVPYFFGLVGIVVVVGWAKLIQRRRGANRTHTADTSA